MPRHERPTCTQVFVSPDTEKMFDLAEEGDVRGVQAVIESIDKSHPGYLETTAGRLNLRTTAICAARYGKLSVMQFLCEERGMPPMAAPQDEIGASFSSFSSCICDCSLM